MANGHPVITQQVLSALEGNGLFEASRDIQHATQMKVRYGLTYAFILVFDTGAIVVQGSPSALTKWLRKVKDCIKKGEPIPRFRWS